MSAICATSWEPVTASIAARARCALRSAVVPATTTSSTALSRCGASFADRAANAARSQAGPPAQSSKASIGGRGGVGDDAVERALRCGGQGEQLVAGQLVADEAGRGAGPSANSRTVPARIALVWSLGAGEHRDPDRRGLVDQGRVGADLLAVDACGRSPAGSDRPGTRSDHPVRRHRPAGPRLRGCRHAGPRGAARRSFPLATCRPDVVDDPKAEAKVGRQLVLLEIVLQ